jgi:hypothetical protein
LVGNRRAGDIAELALLDGETFVLEVPRPAHARVERGILLGACGGYLVADLFDIDVGVFHLRILGERPAAGPAVTHRNAATRAEEKRHIDQPP